MAQSASPTSGELFGTRMREIRMKRGLAQQAVAERAGIAQTDVANPGSAARCDTPRAALRPARLGWTHFSVELATGEVRFGEAV